MSLCSSGLRLLDHNRKMSDLARRTNRALLGVELMLRIIAAVFLLIVSIPARADYENRMIGKWVASAKKDRFGEGGTFIAGYQAGWKPRGIVRTTLASHIESVTDSTYPSGN
jgi:hypothetical protein